MRRNPACTPWAAGQCRNPLVEAGHAPDPRPHTEHPTADCISHQLWCTPKKKQNYFVSLKIISSSIEPLQTGEQKGKNTHKRSNAHFKKTLFYFQLKSHATLFCLWHQSTFPCFLVPFYSLPSITVSLCGQPVQFVYLCLFEMFAHVSTYSVATSSLYNQQRTCSYWGDSTRLWKIRTNCLCRYRVLSVYSV